MKKVYVPERGDIVWIDFDPAKGHEQHGRRPALVISHHENNLKTGLIVVCPISSKQKGYPIEVIIVGDKVSGVVISNQVRTLDMLERTITFAEQAKKEVLNEAVQKLGLIIG